MKTQEMIMYAVAVYLLLHIALATDVIPESLRPLAKKVETEELTTATSAILKGLFA
jgi:hypothetical protein